MSDGEDKHGAKKNEGGTNISDICTCIPMHRYGYRLHVSDNRNMRIYFLVVIVSKEKKEDQTT